MKLVSQALPYSRREKETQLLHLGTEMGIFGEIFKRVNFTAQLLDLHAGLVSVPEVEGFDSIRQQRGLHPSSTEGAALFQSSISRTATEVYMCSKALLSHCAMLIP